MDRIIEVARQTGADAIHPGYGFLSENATFAQKVNEAGIRFVGPSAEAIEVMGDKLSAKQAVQQFGVPLVPGTAYAIQGVAEAQTEAERIGFPVMVKASAGGGGKGMRIVHDAASFAESFQMAVSEAEKSFGNGAVFIEKYVQQPRHIEIQILADQHGHCVYLHERECSIQRRHQKVLEEAPSVILTPDQRQAMGEAAVKAAQSCGYVGAGTVEFIYDASGAFYFLEMNTRLQVEHPVTECIRGWIWFVNSCALPQESRSAIPRRKFPCKAMPWNCVFTPRIAARVSRLTLELLKFTAAHRVQVYALMMAWKKAWTLPSTTIR